MPVLYNIAAFLLMRWLAELAHANRDTMFFLGWVAALIAYALIDRFSHREIPNE